MTHQIKVFNGNPFEIVDYFDGCAYRFAAKESANVDLEAAKHIFGVDFPADSEQCKEESFRTTVFQHLQKRWGWNSTKVENIQDARRKFAKIEFTPVIFKQVELVADAGELEEPREQKTAFKKAAFKPRADEPVEEIKDEEEVA